MTTTSEGAESAEMDQGSPPDLRLMLARFRRGCEVCGVMAWKVVRAEGLLAIWDCDQCGSEFDTPVIDDESSAPTDRRDGR